MNKHLARITMVAFAVIVAAACAPTIERPAVDYRATPAALIGEIIEYGLVAPPTTTMTPFRVESESPTSVVLLSEVTGVFPIAPRYTRLTFSVVQQGDVSSVRVIATGHNAEDTAERFLLHLASVFQRL